jgi:hypothetical protein
MKNEGLNTLVIGGSLNPDRYSNKAIKKLQEYGHNVFAIGLRKGKINGTNLETGLPAYEDIHTVSLYLNAARQGDYFDYLLKLKPKRVIFNPGTENKSLAETLRVNNIEVIEHCNLVMLDYNLF